MLCWVTTGCLNPHTCSRVQASWAFATLQPAKQQCCMHCSRSPQTTFFAAHDVPVTTSLMAVSHNRKYLATAEQLPDTDTMQVSGAFGPGGG